MPNAKGNGAFSPKSRTVGFPMIVAIDLATLAAINREGNPITVGHRLTTPLIGNQRRFRSQVISLKNTEA